MNVTTILFYLEEEGGNCCCASSNANNSSFPVINSLFSSCRFGKFIDCVCN